MCLQRELPQEITGRNNPHSRAALLDVFEIAGPQCDDLVIHGHQVCSFLTSMPC